MSGALLTAPGRLMAELLWLRSSDLEEEVVAGPCLNFMWNLNLAWLGLVCEEEVEQGLVLTRHTFLLAVEEGKEEGSLKVVGGGLTGLSSSSEESVKVGVAEADEWRDREAEAT